MIVFFSAIYSSIIAYARNKLSHNSSKIVSYSSLQVKALRQGLGAIREIKLNNSSNYFVSNFKYADLEFRLKMAENAYITAAPRYFVETLTLLLIAFGGIILYVYSTNLSSLSSYIPLIGAYALSAQKLLPLFQRVYASWGQIKGFRGDLLAVLDYLNLMLHILLLKNLTRLLIRLTPTQFLLTINLN